ncbi:MAG: alpha/beta fold hydrolase [Acidobacteria bacterium]|nr:alpha/beta fold hydrolase [Acidobacteriota bacterium]
MSAVIFSHGKESGPWGRKITVLAQIAEAAGFDVYSVDYRGLPTVGERVSRLLQQCLSVARVAVLVGSSMGGYVAATAAREVRPAGLFLMAPALGLAGYAPDPEPPACRITVIHAWQDDIIPAAHSLRFARQWGAELHLVNDDHRLESNLPLISLIFRNFLESIRAGGGFNIAPPPP